MINIEKKIPVRNVLSRFQNSALCDDAVFTVKSSETKAYGSGMIHSIYKNFLMTIGSIICQS
jgi:hypothetical protein